jgi:hypothetical protein
MNKLFSIFSLILLASFALFSCEDQEEDPLVPQEEKRVGYEILEIISPNEILVWINDEPIEQAEFDSLQLPQGWMKNQPREGEPNRSKFFRSPDEEMDDVFIRKEQFGYDWLLNAKVLETNVPLPANDESLLVGNSIAKHHQVTFHSGRTIFILISPEGEEFIRISRDANRSTDAVTIPEEWRLEERVLTDEITLDLPNPTLNIRVQNNQDSFQGPVSL